jgi:hypothetical protein
MRLAEFTFGPYNSCSFAFSSTTCSTRLEKKWENVEHFLADVRISSSMTNGNEVVDRPDSGCRVFGRRGGGVEAVKI